MKILNIGSMNIDYTYRVDHINLPGETQQSSNREVFLGGKGLNQSIALSKAGARVFHACFVGEGGDALVEACAENGIDSSLIERIAGECGHTIIQIDSRAQNSILVHGGSNTRLNREYIDRVLSGFGEGDFIILQNEVNLLDYIIDSAYERGISVVLNPSPFNDKILECDLSKVSLFMLNEIEGSELSDGKTEPEDIMDFMMSKYPNTGVVLTLGDKGAYYCDKNSRVFQPIFKTRVVDTTAAGDTFMGYFVKGMSEGQDISETLKIAAKASSIAVSKMGAANSIPCIEEVLKQL